MILPAVLALALTGPAVAETVVPTITVSAEGRVEVAPDMASLRVGVVERAASPAEALERASAATRAMLERMAAAGIAPRDLQTSDLALDAVWRHDRERDEMQIAGYEARNVVTVRVRDLARLGQVLDEAVTVGANRFDGLRFGLSDPGAATDEARRRAVAEALRRAALHADAAGVPLGPVLRIVEEGSSAPRPQTMRGADMAEASPVPVAEGELEITARVTVHFGPPE
jgi:hypothetical protein